MNRLQICISLSLYDLIKIINQINPIKKTKRPNKKRTVFIGCPNFIVNPIPVINQPDIISNNAKNILNFRFIFLNTR